MFTRKKWVGSAHAYRTEIDWSAVGGALIIAIFVLAIIGNLAN